MRASRAPSGAAVGDFYHECFEDEEAVHLELRGREIEYDAGPSWVRVRIPVEIWEVIRHRAPAATSYAEWTDEQIADRVSQDVDERIAKYAACEDDKQRAWANLIGCMGYGEASAPREKQIAEGTEYFRKLREEHAERKRRIEALRAAQRR